jgi:hypothetical protein
MTGGNHYRRLHDITFTLNLYLPSIYVFLNFLFTKFEFLIS